MEKDLEARTKRFALSVIRFSSSLPRTREGDVLARQLLRSATSIGANYRKANRGVSRADFANKIGTVQKEAAETHRNCSKNRLSCSPSSRVSAKN
jgi:four helix bundle protein